MSEYRDHSRSRMMGDQSQHELIGALRQLYRASEYSDLKIITRDGSQISAHRAIVCPRSTYLAQAVREAEWHDGIDGEIGMLDDTPELVNLVVEYLYLLDYVPPPRSPSDHSSSSDTLSIRTDPIHFGQQYGTAAISAFGGPRDSGSASPFFTHHRSESQLTVHAMPGGADFNALRPEYNRRSSRTQDASPLATKEPNLVLHARVYAAAERYGIAGLKMLALDKFKIQLSKHWDSTEFSEAIHVVYNLTPPTDKDMREVVADVVSFHRRLLDKPEVEVAIMEINGLAYELLKRARRAEPEYQ